MTRRSCPRHRPAAAGRAGDSRVAIVHQAIIQATGRHVSVRGRIALAATVLTVPPPPGRVLSPSLHPQDSLLVAGHRGLGRGQVTGRRPEQVTSPVVPFGQAGVFDRAEPGGLGLISAEQSAQLVTFTHGCHHGSFGLLEASRRGRPARGRADQAQTPGGSTGRQPATWPGRPADRTTSARSAGSGGSATVAIFTAACCQAAAASSRAEWAVAAAARHLGDALAGVVTQPDELVDPGRGGADPLLQPDRP